MTDTVPNAPYTPDTPPGPCVAIIAYAGAQQSALHGLGEMFDMASGLGAPMIRHHLLSPDSDRMVPEVDAVIVPPNLTGARGETDLRLHHWLAAQHQRGAVVCSACAGAFWLARAGLLDGRVATTHWALEPEFRAAFPQVSLRPEHMLVDEHDIVTAGGVMAWMDLGLHMIQRWCGHEVVSRLCRQMLIDPAERSQLSYRAFRPVLDHGDAPIRALQLWLEAHLEETLSIAVLAAQAGLSERSLQRRFQRSTGIAVQRYIQELRVERAKGFLERSAMPVSEVCWQVGYRDVPAFGRLFRTLTGLSPGAYRERFRVTASRGAPAQTGTPP